MTGAWRDSGERLLLEGPARSREDHLNRLVHQATYAFALEHCAGKRVLDLGCGTGYGTFAIAEVADAVLGVDVCADSLAYAKTRFERGNLQFQRVSDHGALPFDEAAFEVVLSFQVLEHVDDPAAHLREIARLLAPGGCLLLATPNREVRLFRYQRPWNRWHPREFDQRTLQRLLAPCFEPVTALMMGAEARLVEPELARYRLIRWLTLPVTLPGLPDWYRVAGLEALRGLQRLARSGQTPGTFPGDVSDIRIAAGTQPGLNLVVIARRRMAG
ncbi:MAG: class I SAM-dependent methyltransferase [Candidatus Sericytochromatia bacterium]|nr:class I SAM-dependent methyltransferase [Candidatus Sericytochromatia bacterium]